MTTHPPPIFIAAGGGRCAGCQPAEVCRRLVSSTLAYGDPGASRHAPQTRCLVSEKSHDFIVTGNATEIDGKCCLTFPESNPEHLAEIEAFRYSKLLTGYK